MKWFPWILLAVVSAALLFTSTCRKERSEQPERRDTVYIHDTIRDTVPKPLLVRFDHWDTIYIPLLQEDDTIGELPIAIPIEEKEYRTNDYHAIITGYKPELKLMEVFTTSKVITVTKKKRWGIGIQAGVGYPSGWYIGAGINYNIISW